MARFLRICPTVQRHAKIDNLHIILFRVGLHDFLFAAMEQIVKRIINKKDYLKDLLFEY